MRSVCLEGKVYIEGVGKMLHSYTLATDTWDTMRTPVIDYALTVYHSQLVLVGGAIHGSVTNKLWTLVGHNQWIETLPPMPIKRSNTSAVEYSNNNILVAGGWDTYGNINNVEVYNGHHWARARSLPGVCFGQSAILSGHWYLKGYNREVYYASVDSLIASCQPGQGKQSSVWKRLADVPEERSKLVVLGNRLVAVGSSVIQAYSPYSRSWVHVGDLHEKSHSTPFTVVILPSGDLLVSTRHGDEYRASLTGKL